MHYKSLTGTREKLCHITSQGFRLLNMQNEGVGLNDPYIPYEVIILIRFTLYCITFSYFWFCIIHVCSKPKLLLHSFLTSQQVLDLQLS